MNRKEDTDVVAGVPMEKSAGPVLDDERLVLIDALRGLALFGVLAANMRAFNLPLMLYDASEKAFPHRSISGFRRSWMCLFPRRLTRYSLFFLGLVLRFK